MSSKSLLLSVAGILVLFTIIGIASKSAINQSVATLSSSSQLATVSSNPTHPEDVNGDWIISQTEIGPYATCWKTGTSCISSYNAPIDQGYLQKAGTIWKTGTNNAYHYDTSSTTPPGYWVVGQGGTAAPTTNWATALLGPSYISSTAGITRDSHGDYFVAGNFSTSITIGSFATTSGTTAANIFVVKISGSTGLPIWLKRFSNTTGNNYVNGIAVDLNDNLLLAGAFRRTLDFGNGPVTSISNTDVNSDLFLLKLAGTNGGYMWMKDFGAAGTDMTGYSVAIDKNNNNILFSGQFKAYLNLGLGNMVPYYGQAVFVAQFDTNGTCLWQRNIYSSGGPFATHVAVDNSGNTWLAGNYYGGNITFTNGNTSTAGIVLSGQASQLMFLVQYSSTGTPAWAKVLAKPGNGMNQAHSITTDSAGNGILTGSIGPSVDFGNGVSITSSTYQPKTFLAKFDSLGTTTWAIAEPSTNTSEGKFVAVDSSNNLVVTGQFNNTINLGGGALVSAGGNDTFVAKFSGTNGSNIWSKRYGTASDYDSGFGVDTRGGVIGLTGMFAGTTNFGGFNLTASGPGNGFVIQITSP